MCEIYDQIERQGIEKGFEQGIEKGIEQGIEKGIEQGIEKGIEKGIISLFNKGLISASDAAKELKINPDEFMKLVQNQS